MQIPSEGLQLGLTGQSHFPRQLLESDREIVRGVKQPGWA
jgi:hypothetical protein